MFREYERNPSEPPLDFAFKVLPQIKGDNNKWGILYDVRIFWLYFYTSRAEAVRYVLFPLWMQRMTNYAASFARVGEELKG